MLASKKTEFWYDFKTPSPCLSSFINQTTGYWNKPSHSLMCGFKSIPQGCKLLNENGNPWRRQENPLSEVGEIIHRYFPPGSLILDPFCGTATSAEEGLRQGKNFVIGDRDYQLLKHVKVRLQQRYEFLYKRKLLPPFFDMYGDDTAPEGLTIEATDAEEQQQHWVDQVKSRGLIAIPADNCPKDGKTCEHPGVVIKASTMFKYDKVCSNHNSANYIPTDVMS